MENGWVSGWMKGRVIYRPVVYVLINHNYSNDFGRKEVDWCIARKIKRVHKTLWNLTIVTAGVTRVMGLDHNLREWGPSHELFKFLYYQFSLHALSIYKVCMHFGAGSLWFGILLQQTFLNTKIKEYEQGRAEGWDARRLSRLLLAPHLPHLLLAPHLKSLASHLMLRYLKLVYTSITACR